MVNYIYAIKNVVNNKIYIGSTKNMKYRKYKHFYQLKRGIHGNVYLQKSYIKYGKDKFHFYLVEECLPQHRKEREIYWITYYNTQDKNLGYNIYEPNGDKFKCSVETKNKLSATAIKNGISQPIDVYTVDLIYLNTFDSISECARFYQLKSSSIISEILKGEKRLTYKGMTFFKKGETPFIRKSPKQRNMSNYYK